MPKTRIRVKEFVKSIHETLAIYYPERKGFWGGWKSLEVSCTLHGGSEYCTYSLDEAKTVIDTFLKRETEGLKEKIIEYPAPPVPPATTEDV